MEAEDKDQVTAKVKIIVIEGIGSTDVLKAMNHSQAMKMNAESAVETSDLDQEIGRITILLATTNVTTAKGKIEACSADFGLKKTASLPKTDFTLRVYQNP